MFNAAKSFQGFKDAGVQFMYLWWTGYAPENYEWWTQAFNLTDQASGFPDDCIGFCTAFWQGTPWEPSRTTYDQHYQYSAIEFLANAADGMVLAPGTRTGTNNSNYFGLMQFVPGGGAFTSTPVAGFLCDIGPTTVLDYLLVNKNTFTTNIDQGGHLPKSVSFYDALLYCNNLSKRDGLDTVYSYGTTAISGVNPSSGRRRIPLLPIPSPQS
jgi:hypothetical protein